MSSHSGHGGSLRAPSCREGGAARRVLSSIERRDPDRVNPTGTHAGTVPRRASTVGQCGRAGAGPAGGHNGVQSKRPPCPNGPHCCKAKRPLALEV